MDSPRPYDGAYNHMLEYLEIGSEDELTREHLQECETLIDYLEDHDKGGMGQDMNGHSPTYYAYYRVMMDWIENFDLEHTDTIRMKYFRKFIMFVVDSWRLVMDNRYNPLKYILTQVYKLILHLSCLQCGQSTLDSLQVFIWVG